MTYISVISLSLFFIWSCQSKDKYVYTLSWFTLKTIADFRPAKRLKNHTLWGDTPLYSRIGHVPYSYRGVPPGQCHRLNSAQRGLKFYRQFVPCY